MKTPSLRDYGSFPYMYLPRWAFEEEKASNRLIKPTSPSHGLCKEEIDAYIAFIEKSLYKILPVGIYHTLSSCKDTDLVRATILSLSAELPILQWNQPDTAPCTLVVTLLCLSDYTNGVGRYVCDALTRWLIPGAFLSISAVHSLSFKFIAHPDEHFYFHQTLLQVDDAPELSLIHRHFDGLQKEIRLSILAGRHARKIVSLKQLSSEQKKAVIEENLAAVIDLSQEHSNETVFHHMHRMLLQLKAEDKIQQIKERLASSLTQKPKVFDREIFHEIKHSILLLGTTFLAIRDIQYVSRLISFQHLFRKVLQRRILTSPQERHLSLKLLKTQLSFPSKEYHNKTVLGIVGGINLIRDNELFEERHILEAISHCLANVRCIEGSLVVDRRSHDPIRLFYVEIERKDGTPFSLQEGKILKKELPHALKESVESILHPVLMPRNEEEIMRNILLLSQQLKFANDLPQVVISFAAQRENELLFTVILLRPGRPKNRPLPEMFKEVRTPLQLHELEVKNVGLLRKRYPKEANIFKVSLNKQPFLRKDFTIDLFKARQTVSYELHKLFKGIRDFNGGILSKQQEVFQELQNLVKAKSSRKGFLLENFFYCLTPSLHQTLLSPAALKTLFSLMQESLEADLKEEPFFIKALFEQEMLFVTVTSKMSSLKEALFALIATLQISTAELTSSHVNAYGVHCVGYIYQHSDPAIRNLFYSALLNYTDLCKR